MGTIADEVVNLVSQGDEEGSLEYLFHRLNEEGLEGDIGKVIEMLPDSSFRAIFEAANDEEHRSLYDSLSPNQKLRYETLC